MAMCEICEKTLITGRKFSYRGSQTTKRSKTTQSPNIRKVRVVYKGATRSASVCTRCLRSEKVVRAV